MKVPQRKNNRYMAGTELLQKGMKALSNVRLGKKSGYYKTLTLGETFSKENLRKVANAFKRK